jgi:hypothetical protein
MLNVRIYQIYYSDETRRALDPGFIPLDNMANERPDWREYWPIRKFFMSTELRDDELYGFLSPKFGTKGGLSSEAVKAFIRARSAEADVFIFSPYFDMSAFFVNVFEQGEAAHPGLLEAAQKFFLAIDFRVDVTRILNDSQNTAFCNYFVATARFWRAWFEVAEKLFAICEGPDSSLKRDLNAPTGHGQERVAMKVFVLERLATLLLCNNPEFRSKAYCPIDLPRSGIPRIAAAHEEALICDALKIAYRSQRFPQYMKTFQDVRDRVFTRSDAKPSDPAGQRTDASVAVEPAPGRAG